MRPSSKTRHRLNSWTPHNAFAARRMRRRLEPSEDRPRSFCRCIVADGQFDGVHDAVGFGQNFDDALVVADVVIGQCAALAVFQAPFVGLIGGAWGVPSLRGTWIEINIGRTK